MIKKILVPVDGSGPSGKALKLAVDIAEKYDANLSVLFVASHKIDEELQHFTNHEYNLKDSNAVKAVSKQMGKSTINRMINNLKTTVMIKPVVLFGNWPIVPIDIDSYIRSLGIESRTPGKFDQSNDYWT